MTNSKKLGIAAFVVACTAVAGYFLGHPLLGSAPPADPKTDRIAFVAGSTPALSGLFLNYDIYVMNVDKPGIVRVTQQTGMDDMPAWSPQGDRIAYTRVDGLYVMNADGSGQPEFLWRSHSRGTLIQPAWSPNGSKIAFSEGILYVLDIKTGQVTQLTDSSVLSYDPTWSPDGKRIAFTVMPNITTSAGGPEGGIAVMDAEGSGFVPWTNIAHGSSGSPDWSPDGKQIAFNRDGDIYVMSADGTDVRALTHDGENGSPTWSPDGTRIAFVSFKNARCGVTLTDAPAFCTSELYTMNADGSNVSLIRGKRNEKIIRPAWSP